MWETPIYKTPSNLWSGMTSDPADYISVEFPPTNSIAVHELYEYPYAIIDINKLLGTCTYASNG